MLSAVTVNWSGVGAAGPDHGFGKKCFSLASQASMQAFIRDPELK